MSPPIDKHWEQILLFPDYKEKNYAIEVDITFVKGQVFDNLLYKQAGVILDSALIRKGRIDASIPVVYPDFKSRVAIAIDKMEKARTLKFINKSSLDRIATETGGWPYTALTSLCSFVAEKVAAASLSKGRRAFDPILKAATAEHESSFTLLAYERRWRGIKRYSQELLNEYLAPF